MPNLVVYVPTSLWKRIEELGLADPKIEARKVARGALESWLSLGSDEAMQPDLEKSPRADARAADSDPKENPQAPEREPRAEGWDTSGSATASPKTASATASRSGNDPHFKPDFKK